eukprot:TRINITY_DN17966_c0_g1_i2.p2 TRINITY_DN17966_c0_g1~~TRINITY_DN17966_c0_g1_i2.p2  ORF type:complete len:146 (+),score=25.47 TRINITY_DN17966_c0_g1_i2:155-592(+)
MHFLCHDCHPPTRCAYEVILYGSVFLLAGSDADGPRLAGNEDRPRLSSSGTSAPPAARGRTKSGAARSQQSSRKQSGKKAPSHWERVKREATQAVKSASRATLLTKPARVLQDLMRDLGISCKSCMEKSQLVDKLQAAVGVHEEL